ncbi:MAG TPA: hypothetical protein VIK18_07355 [Pirellulales bacterium]
MARSLGRILWLAFWLLSAAGQVQAGDGFKQWMGCGYGPGYNAPVPPGGAGCGLLNNWGRGCCEVPSSWRLHVWDGYQGDPASYQRSLVGAQPDVNHLHQHRGAGIGPGIGGGNAVSCPYCQGGGASTYPLALPAATTVPPPVDFQPDAQSGRANSSIRSER